MQVSYIQCFLQRTYQACDLLEKWGPSYNLSVQRFHILEMIRTILRCHDGMISGERKGLTCIVKQHIPEQNWPNSDNPEYILWFVSTIQRAAEGLLGFGPTT
jgi:hypothetical protein